MSEMNTINADVTMDGGASGTLLAGRYRVVRQLGQGGMGSVWLAEDLKLDGHKVAVKMMPSILVNNRRAFARVKAEALVSLKLSHPNIATVRAFEEEGGNPFLVMDYIDGQTLDDYLAENGTLTEEETIKLLKPVAAALDYAHAQGVVHRDVKPGNVMIRKDGTPFVLDFGIAREIQETMTRVTGKLSSGTLLYMSPEQLNGAAPKPAQDIYSFAAMVYECLKGAPPFSRGQIEYQIVNNEPEPLDPQFARCSSGVMAGLAKSPEARPTDCKSVLMSIEMSQPKPQGNTRKVRNKFKVILLLVVAIGGVLAITMLLRPGAGRHEGVSTPRWIEILDRIARHDGKPQEMESDSVVSFSPVDEEQEHRRLELAAEASAFSLSSQMDTVSQLIAREPEDVRACFEAEIHAFENLRRAGDDAKASSRNVTATNLLTQTKAKADALKELIAVRGSCLAAKERAEAEKQSADAVDAKSALSLRYQEAESALNAVASLAEKRDFAAAKERAESARNQFVALRADVVKAAISEAEWHKSSERWELCFAIAEKVLGWESANAEAAALKAEAVSHLKPTLRIVAKIGDREVPAMARFNGKTCTSPWIWEEGLKEGLRFPNAEVAVAYADGGKRYVGTIKPETIDWKGPRTVTVTLVEYNGPKPKPGDTKTITLPGGATMEMVWCPPRSFMMGSPESEEGRYDDETQHHVTLTEGFWIGKYEVTQRQWESVMGENPSYFKGADRPVEQVSWNDCQEFIRKINAAGRVSVSLPTEAQWEYACRAGTTTPFSFGSTINSDKANYSGKETAIVGSYAPNAWGLYDMHGNVWELCADWYGAYNGAVTNPTGPASGTLRVFRGGGWVGDAQSCRSAIRIWFVPGNRNNYLGLRLVCSAGPEKKSL